MRDPKQKTSDALRVPQPKKKLGLTVPPALRLPHDDLITPQNKPVTEPQASMPSQTSQPSHTTSQEEVPTEYKEAAVSPQRDFTKVANSINREAVPAGMFTGKSKQLYDCLYTLTRGAINPTRSVRISRPKLMKQAHIGSRITFDTNVERLIKVGLISVNKITGEHKGNEYVVFLPEELTETMTSQTSLTSLTSSAQKLVRLVRLETSHSRHTSNPVDSTTYDTPKTSFKTYDDDTHTVKDFLDEIVQAAREIVGGKLNDSEKEKQRWGRLGNLLAEELRGAAAKTENISSVPSFFEAHLRRKLTNKSAAPLSEPTSKPKKAQKEPVDLEPKQGVETQPGKQSKFSLEECKRYAEHLRDTRQGIINPGGYALTIHRTGEVDTLVEAFFKTPTKTDSIDTSHCPDCNGTGYWYPQGKDKGVARCKHQRLVALRPEVDKG